MIPPVKIPRIPQIDFFRGLMLIIMMLDHLQYFPFISLITIAHPYTFQTLGFVSAAEGFFFLSGLVFALVYAPKYLAQGAGTFTRLALRRAGYVYLWYIGTYLSVILLFCLPLFRDNWPLVWHSQEIIKDTPFTAFLLAAVFLHQTGLVDLLCMYVIYIACTPLAARLLAHGRAPVLLAICAALWLLGQARPQLMLEQFSQGHITWNLAQPPAEMEELPRGLYLPWFELLSWQLMFYAGFILGWLRVTVTDFQFPIRRGWLVTALAICLPLLIWRHTVSAPEDWDTIFLSDRGLGIIRLINTAALFYLIYALCRRKPDWFRGGALVRLGQTAIQVFAFHVFLCYALTPFRPDIAALSVPVQLALWLLATTTIYLPIPIIQIWRRRTAA